MIGYHFQSNAYVCKCGAPRSVHTAPDGGCTWCPCPGYVEDTDPSIEREWKFWEGENLDG